MNRNSVVTVNMRWNKKKPKNRLSI